VPTCHTHRLNACNHCSLVVTCMLCLQNIRSSLIIDLVISAALLLAFILLQRTSILYRFRSEPQPQPCWQGCHMCLRSLLIILMMQQCITCNAPQALQPQRHIQATCPAQNRACLTVVSCIQKIPLGVHLAASTAVQNRGWLAMPLLQS
jgi:hypothetical protein